MTQDVHPLIGTAIWVRKDGKVMLSRRAKEKRSGAGTWCPPGGHLEMFETIQECAVRETREESGVEIDNIRFLTVVEDIEREKGAHYLTFHFVADWKSGEPCPQAGESEEWSWYPWGELPEPLFQPVLNLLKTGFNPLEFKS